MPDNTRLGLKGLHMTDLDKMDRHEIDTIRKELERGKNVKSR